MENQRKTLSKGRKITAWILVGLLGALFVMSGAMKLMGSAEMTTFFVKYGLEGKNILIGTGELIAVILFVVPKTSSLGVLLLSAHMGGAIATHMEHGESYILPTILLLFVWVANWLRNPEMFSSFTRKRIRTDVTP